MLKSFSKDFLKYLPSQIVPALAGFITAPIITRLFLPAEFGNYALAEGVVSLLYGLTVSGFGSSAIRFFPAYKIKLELGVFFTSLVVSLGIVIISISALAFFLLTIFKSYIPADFFPLLILSVLIFAFGSLFDVCMNVVRAQERSGTYSFFALVTKYGGLGISLLLVIVFGFRIEGMMLGELAAPVLGFPILYALTVKGTPIRSKDFRPNDIKQIWSYAWPLNVGNLAMWALILSDRYIISIFRAASEVGLYAAAYNLSSKSIDMLVQLFLLSMGPLVNNVWENQGRVATEKSIAMITRLFLIICLPAAVGVTVLAYPFMAILTGAAYREGYRIVGYVAFSSFIYGLSQIASRGMLISKATKRLSINQVLAAVVNIGLNLLLVPRYGYIVAGITTLIGYSLLLVLQAHGSRPHIAWRFPFKTLRNSVLASIVMGISSYTIYAYSANTDHVKIGYFFLSVAIGVLIYFSLIWLSGEVTPNEKTFAIKYLKRKSNAESA